MIRIDARRDNTIFEMTAREGDTIRDLVKRGTELTSFLECSCDGIMACSTCHVILPEEAFKIVGPAPQAEQDMLDLAYGVCETCVNS